MGEYIFGNEPLGLLTNYSYGWFIKNVNEDEWTMIPKEVDNGD